MTSGRAVADEIRDILAAALERTIAPGENVTRVMEPKWDSLKHMEIVFSIEDAFDLQYHEDELASLNSLAALVESVERRHAA
jgi:acyl carrier protein